MAEKKYKSFRLSAHHNAHSMVNESILELEHNFKRLFALVGFFVLLVCTVFYRLIGGLPLITWINALAALLLLVCLILDLKTKLAAQSYQVAMPFFLLIYLPVSWIGTPGILGGVPMIALFFLMLLAIMRNHKVKNRLVIAYFFTLAVLLFVDIHRVDFDSLAIKMEFFIKFIIFVGLAPAIWIFLTIYLSRTSEHHTDIYQQSITDELTGCYNMRYGADQLRRMQSYYKRNNHSFSVILFDVDHFKKYNDKYGHQAGDEVLTKLCNCIRSTTRLNDILIRYGGDEFVLLLPGAKLPQAITLARLLLARIRKLELILVHEPMTVSMGVIDSASAAKHDMDILKQADELMYAAKEKGRNCIVAADIDV